MKRSNWAVLLACAAASSSVAVFADPLSDRMAALMKVASAPNYQAMEVPSAGSFIADQITLMSLAAGADSVVSDQLVEVLSKPEPVQLAVTGEDDAIAAATLERALTKVRGRPLAAHQLAYIGSKEFEEPLTKTAVEAGIKLLFVVYP
ncbi:hypothetical protein [Variovorax sp. HJSM1_2]|uniref:hypothetical protein n=1 Tax=Variovorax sp. HJSM1_2 TaxID=3366263 RepID=UPI003BD9BCE2